MTTILTKSHFIWIRDVKYEHLIAGVSGGLTSTLILHPIDLIKVRFAVNDDIHKSIPKYKGVWNAFQTIYQQEGFKGLYRGVLPNLWGAGTSWGLYFLFYNSIKEKMKEKHETATLSSTKHLLAASEAGALTLLITNPFWVVKTRMCLQMADGQANSVVKYNGMVDVLVKIYKMEGIRGYYKGFIPGLLGVSHGAVQFVVYEALKNKFYENNTANKKMGNKEYLFFAAISKFCAATLTYPYQVIRARLQNQHYSYNSLFDCMRLIWNYEGWRGYYKGLAPNLLRVIPATMITFVTYENVSHFLMNRNA